MGVDLDSFVSVPLPVDLYAELARRFPGGVSSVLEHVAQDFLERTAQDHPTYSRTQGVHWETLLLPNGTEVRTKYFGEYKIAVIKDESIVWEGVSYASMSRLARAMRGGTSNNAWKVLEVKRPNDSRWQLADVLRR